MPLVPGFDRELLYSIILLLFVAIALGAVFLFYRYVHSVTTQTRLAETTRLADAAIDYVEDLDRRGDIVVPGGMEKGAYKRQLASRWLQSELHRDGFRISDDQAQKWIAAAFHKRAGDSQPVNKMDVLARQAVDLTQTLERAHLIALPPDVDQHLYLAGLGADWITVELAKEGMTVSHEQAMTWVRGEILHRLQLEAGKVAIGDRLNSLAEEALQFVADLRSSGRISVRSSTSSTDLETDLATAWLLTEAVKQGLDVTADQIAEAITSALSQQAAPTVVALPAQLEHDSEVQ